MRDTGRDMNESFTSSDDTKRELAERSRIFEIAVRCLKTGAPGLSALTREAVARNIAMRAVAVPSIPMLPGQMPGAPIGIDTDEFAKKESRK